MSLFPACMAFEYLEFLSFISTSNQFLKTYLFYFSFLLFWLLMCFICLPAKHFGCHLILLVPVRPKFSALIAACTFSCIKDSKLIRQIKKSVKITIRIYLEGNTYCQDLTWFDLCFCCQDERVTVYIYIYISTYIRAEPQVIWNWGFQVFIA